MGGKSNNNVATINGACVCIISEEHHEPAGLSVAVLILDDNLEILLGAYNGCAWGKYQSIASVGIDSLTPVDQLGVQR